MISLVVLAMLECSAAVETSVIETSEPVWDVAVEDLNLDGSGDIVALCCDSEATPLKKNVAVYMMNGEDGGYSSEPSFVLPLDPSISSLFWAETNGKTPRELVTTNALGAEIYAYREGKLEKVQTTEFLSLLPSGAKEPRFLREIPKDLDGDGIDEWLIPANGGYIVRNADAQHAFVTCDVVSEIREEGSLQIRHKLPAYQVFSLENQAPKGIVFLSNELADFAHGDNWTEHQRYKVPSNTDEKWDTSAQMQDIDGNGLPDLVVTQSKGTVNVTVMSRVYVASAPFTYPDEPSAVFHADGAIAAPFLIDVDGDEKLDVMFIKVPFGLKTLVNLFLRKKVAVEVDVFLFNGSAYNAKPDFSTSITLDAPEQRELPVYIMADFNGDGRVDVMFGSGNSEVAIHTGETNRFISNKPWVTLPFIPFGQARPYDLNDNKAKDVVLFHPGGKDAKKIEVAVF
ncbi:MAG TPA: VCBS repeat-containing protein [Candidatus Hydrogenedentes bacterium]|nr:VCBS repeat-containing protein [Candidatus Hydrogenedentota bacterium]